MTRITLTSKVRSSATRKRALAQGYRSGLEEKIARGLTASGVSFEFEQEKLRYTQPAKERTYTPDFVITTRSGKAIYIESKGRFVTSDRQKHLMVRDSNPDLDIRFVFSNPNNRISKQSKTTYAAWCEKNGFMYAKFDPNEVIPQDWLDE